MRSFGNCSTGFLSPHTGHCSVPPRPSWFGRGDPSLWHCFACHAGGSVYDFAALLAGYALPLRGAAFLTVRDGLLDHYGFSRQVAA